MKTGLCRYEEEIVSTLSIGYDECHRSRLRFLYGRSVAKIQKNSLPAVHLRENVHPIQDSRDWTDVCTRNTFVLFLHGFIWRYKKDFFISFLGPS